MAVNTPIEKVRSQARAGGDVARRADDSKWVERLGRFGLVAKGASA